MSIQKGDIYYADLRPVIGSEQGGIRPVLVIQNDMGNRYSPTVIVAAITSQTGKPTGRGDKLLLGQVDRALAVSFGMCM